MQGASTDEFCTEGVNCADDCPTIVDDCTGWVAGDEWEGPEPTDPVTPEDTMSYDDTSSVSLGMEELHGPFAPEYSAHVPFAASMLPSINQCRGKTMDLHFSSYDGSVSVHGRTECDRPALVTVLTFLYRQTCVFKYCWWVPGGYPGFNSEIGTWVETFSNGLGCTRGYYLGVSFHTAGIADHGDTAVSTSAKTYVICA
jgi:hypothetical protein